MQKPCREALELLVQGSPQQPEPARRILATGTPEGWRYDYLQPGGAASDDDCVVSGTLVLPADTPVRFLVTASDTIRPWRLPQFGLDLTGIPGRIEEATIKLPPGESGDQAAPSAADEKPVAVRVLAPDAYAEWEGQTLPPSCFASG
jgi:heme/copper-type cytochrome/quinol oxidase subunit 2